MWFCGLVVWWFWLFGFLAFLALAAPAFFVLGCRGKDRERERERVGNE